MIQRGRVGVGRIAVRRALIRVRQRRGRRFHGLRRFGASRAARDVGGDGFPGHPLVLLRQPPDERVGRGEADRTVERLEIPGQDPQKCALAGAVGADDADHIARRHGHVETLEEGAMGESACHVLRDERCGHRGTSSVVMRMLHLVEQFGDRGEFTGIDRIPEDHVHGVS